MRRYLLIISVLLISCNSYGQYFYPLLGRHGTAPAPSVTTYLNSTGAGGHGTNSTISTILLTNDNAALTSGSQSIAQLGVTETSGLWRFSFIVTYNNPTKAYYGFGFASVDDVGNGQFPTHSWEFGVGVDVSGTAYSYKCVAGSLTVYGSVPTSATDTFNVALNMTTGKFWTGIGQTWFGSGDPDAGINPTGTWSPSTIWPAVGVGIYSGGTCSIQRVANSYIVKATSYTDI